MAQDERESKYSDEIFDSDEDSDGFEPKCKTKPKKKKSNKRSVWLVESIFHKRNVNIT